MKLNSILHKFLLAIILATFAAPTQAQENKTCDSIFSLIYKKKYVQAQKFIEWNDVTNCRRAEVRKGGTPLAVALLSFGTVFFTPLAKKSTLISGGENPLEYAFKMESSPTRDSLVVALIKKFESKSEQDLYYSHILHLCQTFDSTNVRLISYITLKKEKVEKEIKTNTIKLFRWADGKNNNYNHTLALNILKSGLYEKKIGKYLDYKDLVDSLGYSNCSLMEKVLNGKNTPLLEAVIQSGFDIKEYEDLFTNVIKNNNTDMLRIGLANGINPNYHNGFLDSYFNLTLSNPDTVNLSLLLKAGLSFDAYKKHIINLNNGKISCDNLSLLLQWGAKSELRTIKCHEGKWRFSVYKDTMPGFDSIAPFIKNSNLAPVLLKGKWGLVDCLGDIALKCAYDNILHENMFYYSRNGHSGVVNCFILSENGNKTYFQLAHTTITNKAYYTPNFSFPLPYEECFTISQNSYKYPFLNTQQQYIFKEKNKYGLFETDYEKLSFLTKAKYDNYKQENNNWFLLKGKKWIDVSSIEKE